MTEKFEPIAQEPAPQVAPVSSAPASARRNVWQVVGVTAIAAAAGLGGFVVGNHNDTIRPAGHVEQWGGPQPGAPLPGGPMGGNMKPGDGRGMRMAPHCEDASGNHAAVLPDGSCPSGYTLDDKGGMRMAPHCEDASGNHAAVLPNGSCPSGYTLDDKGGMPGQMAPAVSPSATPQS